MMVCIATRPLGEFIQDLNECTSWVEYLGVILVRKVLMEAKNEF